MNVCMCVFLCVCVYIRKLTYSYGFTMYVHKCNGVYLCVTEEDGEETKKQKFVYEYI